MNKSYQIIIQYISVILTLSVLNACQQDDISNHRIDRYQALTQQSNNIESFLYFTDPHISTYDKLFYNYLDSIYYYYANTSTQFCICGGDWLNNMDTQIEAETKLKKIDEVTKELFGSSYFMILGNHDTNYQGRLDEKSEINTGQLSQEKIIDILFEKQGNAFYTFNSSESKYIVLDSGIDWDSFINEYRQSQINWFINELIGNNKKHIVILIHIYTNDLVVPQPFAMELMNISESFNNKVCNSKYDFSKSIGTIACFICGHSHVDFVDTNNSIPIIGITHLKDQGVPTFDLCMINWDNNTFNTIRIGAGEDRSINLAPSLK